MRYCTLIAVFSVSISCLFSQPVIPPPTQTDQLIIDAGTPGSADPNDRIRYTVTIQNTGNAAATMAQLNAVLDPATTLVPGSFKTSPLASNDAYAATGNVGLNVNAANGLKANDFDDNIPGLTLTAGTFATTAGGSITIIADGSFTYTPLTGYTGMDTYVYTLNDGNGVGGGVPATDMATVTFTVSNLIWFVDNTGGGSGGTGSLSNPFKTLTDFNGSAGPQAGHVAFIKHTGTNYPGGIVLKVDQYLFGTGHTGGANLGDPGVLPFTVALHSMTLPLINGTRPVIAPAAGSAITIANNNTIRGIATSGGANGILATNIVSLSFIENTMSGSTAEGVRLNNVTGTVVLTNSNISAAGNGIHLTSTSGALNLNLSTNTLNSNGTAAFINGIGGAITITGFASNTVSQNTVGSGFNITNARFDGTPGGAFQVVSGGSTVIGISGNGVGASGMLLNSVTGDLSFTDLDIYCDGGTGLLVTSTGEVNAGAGTGFRLVVASGVCTLDANGGPAVNVNGASINLPMMSFLRSTNSLTTGISLVNAFGGVGSTTLSASAGSISDPVGASGTAVNISGGNGNITIDIPVTNNSGNAVVVSSRGSGTILFSKAINETGSGISLTTNTGATINFTGGLTISTGATTGFNATGGGTVNVTGTNTISSTSATALNVTSTTIGASNLNFQSISSGNNTAAADPVNGIVLNNTGAGRLIVTGNGNNSVGGNSSGGTIQSTTGDAISLTTTNNPSFTNINIQNIGKSGIDGMSVTSFTLANSTINNVGTAMTGQYEESNLSFNDMGTFTSSAISGTVSITQNVLNNARRHGIQIETGTGTISNITVSNNTLTSSTNSTVSLGTAVLILIQGTASTTAHLTTGTFSGNTISNFPSGEGIAVLGGSGNGSNNTSSTLGANATPINITGNFVNGGATRMGSNAIRASMNSQFGIMNFNISNNTQLTNIQGQGISYFVGGTITGSATISGNTIVANQTLLAGTQGLAVQVDDGPAGLVTSAADYNITINNNSVSAYEGSGIRAIARASLGKLDVVITNNTVGTPIMANRNGIRVDAGSAAGDVTLCMTMTGNTSAGSGVNQGIGIRKQGNVATVNDFGIVGLVPSPTTGANAAAKVVADNPAGGGCDVISGDNYVSCTLSL